MAISSMRKGHRGQGGRGPFRYSKAADNHVIWPRRAQALRDFLQPPHKRRNAFSSNSEDALTWSCFESLKHVSPAARGEALADIWELAFHEPLPPADLVAGDIHVGKRYPENKTAIESTEVDASIESLSALVFIEAKLYSPMSQADPDNDKPHNQIERKLRIGLREATNQGKEFFFIILDIAPLEALRSLKAGVSLAQATHSRSASGFAGKWLTAYWFARYKYGRQGSLSPLAAVISNAGVPGQSAKRVARNMGWLTWSDLFKAVLRAVVTSN